MISPFSLKEVKYRISGIDNIRARSENRSHAVFHQEAVILPRNDPAGIEIAPDEVKAVRERLERDDLTVLAYRCLLYTSDAADE